MSESDWLADDYPFTMLNFLYEAEENQFNAFQPRDSFVKIWTNPRDRKLRLFGQACCRRISNMLTDERSRNAIEIAEKYAEGIATREELVSAGGMAADAAGLPRFGNAESWGMDTFPAGMEAPARAAAFAVAWYSPVSELICIAAATAAAATWGQRGQRGHEFLLQADFLRDIFGNPFRAITIDSRWLTSNVVDLARAIYEERGFDKMPILADALTDAGCDNEEMLNHCRSNGLHVRGCWALDLLLSKA